jgi:hypothetical protein
VFVNRVPCVVLEQWLCVRESRSLRSSRAVAVLVNRGPCVVLEQWLFVSESRSVRST